MTVEYAGRPGTLRREGMDDPPWRSGDDEWTVAGEPESSAWWYPANDHPSDPARLDVSVRVPKEYQAISIGRLASRDTAQEADFDTWHWVMSESLPTYASFLAIGHYELREGEADGRPYVYAASTRFSADERATLFAAMERTPALVREIEAFAGPYPYSEIGGIVPATDALVRRAGDGHPTDLRRGRSDERVPRRAAGARARAHVVRRPRHAAAVERHLHQRGLRVLGVLGGRGTTRWDQG